MEGHPGRARPPAFDASSHGELIDEAALAEMVGWPHSVPRKLLRRQAFEAQQLGDDGAWRSGVGRRREVVARGLQRRSSAAVGSSGEGLTEGRRDCGGDCHVRY